MSVAVFFFHTSSSRAAACAVVCLLGGKKCKRVAGLSAGLMMVKKSKKRNPT